MYVLDKRLTKPVQSGIILDMTTRTDVPKYELLGYDETTGNEIRLYPDGAKRNQYGHLLERPNYDGIQTITKDNAHDYLRRRKEKILESIEKSVMDVTKTRLPSDAIGAIVGKRAEIAMNDDTRVGNEAAKIVLQAIDAYQNRIQENNSTNVLRQEVTLDDNTRALLERVAQLKYNGVIDASATDADDD